MEGALWTVDWEGMFTPARSVLEMAVRATIMYFVIVALQTRLSLAPRASEAPRWRGRLSHSAGATDGDIARH